ncbi:MAG TPA: DNA-binding domain-containing protein, partial [Myxococcaceae bacterium]|nr:DNA-binding domain-containing protein [Myxococcaceae bacterium]
MTLAELQALLHGRITGMVPGREDELRAEVVSRPPLQALERVEIYVRMYLHRLVDAIAEDVPHTSQILGHDAFVEVVRAYLHEHPSRSPDIMQAGRSFGAWLRAYRGIRADLPDLALLERARSEVRIAPDAPVAGAEELQSLNADALPAAHFLFSPSLRLLRLQHDVRTLW